MISVSIEVKEKGKGSPNYSLEGDMNGEMTLSMILDFYKRAMISVSRYVLNEEQSKGFDKTPLFIIDGAKGRAIEDVSPFGKVEIRSRIDSQYAIKGVYEYILSKSPVDTGFYLKSNLVLVNGTLFANSLETLDSALKTFEFRPGDIIRFVNIAPYARLLERLGITAGKRSPRLRKTRDKQRRSGTHVLAENGVYFLASRMIRNKFKGNFDTRFELVTGQALGLSEIPSIQRPGRKSYFGKRFSKKGKNHRKGKNSYLYPSIKIRVTEGGIL